MLKADIQTDNIFVTDSRFLYVWHSLRCSKLRIWSRRGALICQHICCLTRECTCNITTVARSRNHCFHGHATLRYLCVNVSVAVNNTKPLSVWMEAQQCFTLALLSSHKIFRTFVNNINILRFRVTCPIFLSDYNWIWRFSTDFCVRRRCQISEEFSEIL